MNGKAVFQGGNAQSLDNIAGQPIAEYTHSKSGTIHKLEGPEKARNIVFKATGDYNDGDTWTLNNHPVIVTYNGGEELLPTAVLVGDVVQAVVMESKLRLMLQKPTPQESLIENGHFVNPINQRGKTDYTTVGYTIDRWRLDSLGTVSIGSNKIILTASSENTLYFSQLLNVTDKILDKIMTFSVLLANGSIYYATGTIREGIHITNISSGWISCYMINTRPGILFTAGKGLVLEPVAAKLEPGNRFTGWPVWDYGAELRKCQRYFYKTVLSSNGFFQMNGIAYRSNELDSILFLPVAMREGGKPVIQYSAGEKLAAWSPKNDSWGSTTHNITDIILEQFSGNQALLSIATTGLDIGENYFWQTKGGYISFSRDL